MAKMKNFHIKLPEAAYDALESLAEKDKRPMADVVREGLEEYTRARGLSVSFEVERGGYREKK